MTVAALVALALVPIFYSSPTAAACHWDFYHVAEIDQEFSGPFELRGGFTRAESWETKFDASHGVHGDPPHRHDIATHHYVLFCTDIHRAEVHAIFSHKYEGGANLKVTFIDSGVEIVQVSNPPDDWAEVTAGGVGNSFVTFHIEGDAFTTRTWDLFVYADVPSDLWGDQLTIHFHLQAIGYEDDEWEEQIKG